MFGWLRKHVRKIGVFGVEVEFHPPADAAPQLVTRDHSAPVTVGAVRAEDSVERAGPSADESVGMTFDAAIRAIRERHPEAVLGRTAERGPYFERARHLTNYQMRASDPPWYGAIQPNGKTMWLYLGRGGKICCGDKEWGPPRPTRGQGRPGAERVEPGAIPARAT